MKVLLTGALGNIGLYTLDALLKEGHDVVAFDLESPNGRKIGSRLGGRVRFARGDITDPACVCAALEGVDAVVHLAGIIPPAVDRAPDLAWRVNVDGTRNLIEQMESSDPHMRHGSIAVVTRTSWRDRSSTRARRESMTAFRPM
jgi:nucleoside-diphosphate-sugar epimerase